MVTKKATLKAFGVNTIIERVVEDEKKTEAGVILPVGGVAGIGIGKVVSTGGGMSDKETESSLNDGDVVRFREAHAVEFMDDGRSLVVVEEEYIIGFYE